MIRASEFNLRDPDLTCNQSTADLVDAAAYTAALNHPAAVDTFHTHFDALIGSDTVVLVLPCGRSAHTELGWAVGAGKRTAILLDDPCTPELMYRMVDRLVTDLDELIRWLAEPELTRAIPPGRTPQQLLAELLPPHPHRKAIR